MKIKRPPIVVVMGHVDHGKTTLLDYIRKTNVASREAGGITQSIGAYEIEVRSKNEPKSRESAVSRGILRVAQDDFATESRKITFIDTPGHEAFSKMRARGAKVADLAILVVAADEGLKPQTKDALQYILGEKLSYVVAINKIDKSGADVEKIKQEFAQSGVFLEGFGGDISWHAISAKTGEGVPELLDLVLLAADIQGLAYDPEAEPSGVVLSAYLDSRRGLVVDAILKDGKLKTGDVIYTKGAKAKIRALADFTKKNIKEATPSQPVEILGFEKQPAIGDEFSKNASIYKSEAKKVRGPHNKDGEEKFARLILKANESGSLEALEHVVEKINKTHPVIILEKSIGDIYETDVKLAGTSKAIILGFNVRIDKAADTLVKTQKIRVLNSDIIYKIEESLVKLLEEQVDFTSRAIEILAVFGVKDGRQIIGGKVIAGLVKNQESFKVLRGEGVIGEGKITNLQSGRKDVVEAPEGVEVGLLVEASAPIIKGDKLSFVR